MAEYRIAEHPILPIEPRETVAFYWQGQKLAAKHGETIASALFANGVRIFGYHPKDGAPQGIFCANGQCAQCLVLADGRPVKSCMELVQEGLKVEPVKGLPELPPVERCPEMGEIEAIRVPVLIIGGGPSGMSAAIELGKRLPPAPGEDGFQVLLVDDKHRLGGKLVLQTHRFFGSSNAVYAGTRGIDIATKLEEQVRALDSIRVWPNSTALAVFSDRTVGILRGAGDAGQGDQYILVEPQVLLVAAGAREKSLAFKGNTLPGVYGAGAFQTLVNRDLVKAAERLFIVGGGNVGLIAGYHALQAGISVVGLVEAMPECGGYKVHKDKLARMGVPIYTSHTIVSANGQESVESVTVARVDEHFQPIPGTERSFECDTVLIAVGLDPVNEFYLKAQEFDMTVFAAGDAEEIAEASAAMFSGKIKGLEITRALGYDVGEIPPDWYRTAEILKSKPGVTVEEQRPEAEEGVLPVFHCTQEIPCDPCTAICPQSLIQIDETDIRKLPAFIGEQVNKTCIGCEKCVTICPGLAITLVDYRKEPEQAIVTIAYEFLKESIQVGDVVTVLDSEGQTLGNVEVVGVRTIRAFDRTIAVRVRAPREYAKRIAGIQIQEELVTKPMDHYVERITDDTIVCRCERVTAGEIRELIRQGYRDINEIKAVSRAGMGSCGAKTCTDLIHRLFRDEGIPDAEVTDQINRPLFMEVPLGVFAAIPDGGEENHA
jgi:NADPH-dependent 2,4-dienoyl-CoA reductase/sulfur reductase-like enzyme/Fe-S-cluster-containing hydrogenase component 2/bacterioferritin-associated ferredoxin